MNIKQMTRISLFTAMLIVFTVIVPGFKVPLIETAFTLQTLVIMLTGVMLKPKDAFLSVLLYVLIGAIGIPVFPNGTNGLMVIFGPKGGFYLAFPFAAFLISFFKGNKSLVRLLIVNIAFGIVFVYIFGSLSLSLVLKLPYFKMVYAMLAFVPFDLLKALIASMIGLKLKNMKYLN